MRWVLMIIGGLAGVMGLMNGLTLSPGSAPQQAVQRLDFVIGMLGLSLMGNGYVAGYLQIIAVSIIATKVVTQGQNTKGPAVASEA